LGSALSAEVDHQNYRGLFTFKLSDNPILCPAEPNQFSAVVDKIMEGATEQMRNLANESIAKVNIPSEARHVEAALLKNHVHALVRLFRTGKRPLSHPNHSTTYRLTNLIEDSLQYEKRQFGLTAECVIHIHATLTYQTC